MVPFSTELGPCESHALIIVQACADQEGSSRQLRSARAARHAARDFASSDTGGFPVCDVMSKGRPFGARPSVAVAIAKARRKAGLSQDRLANRLNRCQSYVAKIEIGEREVEVREFVWIIKRIGADPMPLLEQLFRDDDFSDLYQPAKKDPRPAPQFELEPYQIEPYDPADEEPDDDELELGHLKFGEGGTE